MRTWICSSNLFLGLGVFLAFPCFSIGFSAFPDFLLVFLVVPLVLLVLRVLPAVFLFFPLVCLVFLCFSIGRLPFSSLFPYFPWGFLSGTSLRGDFFRFFGVFFLDTCLYVRNIEFLRKASVLGHITGQHSHHVWRGPKKSEVISRR